MRYVFTCQQCGSHKLEEVMINVTVASTCNAIFVEDGEVDIDYGGQSNEGGEIDRYQCEECGTFVVDDKEELAGALARLLMVLDHTAE